MNMKMKKLIAKIPKDKLLHAILGIYVYLFSRICFKESLAILIVVLVGIGIELIHDKWMKRGEPELMDVLATIVGGVSIMIIELLRNWTY